mmetsp:Transcript_21791/g.64278  ORF Transcript_21791/g.64278 Transcript_21791/m.64278 type:complete len:202 (+) Transcript_21791:174-779(+)
MARGATWMTKQSPGFPHRLPPKRGQKMAFTRARSASTSWRSFSNRDAEKCCCCESDPSAHSSLTMDGTARSRPRVLNTFIPPLEASTGSFLGQTGLLCGREVLPGIPRNRRCVCVDAASLPSQPSKAFNTSPEFIADTQADRRVRLSFHWNGTWTGMASAPSAPALEQDVCLVWLRAHSASTGITREGMDAALLSSSHEGW